MHSIHYPRMYRVSRANPCPICGKPGWCLIAPDGSAAICQRVADGSIRRCGDAGYLHRLRGNAHAFHSRSCSPHPQARGDLAPLASRYQRRLTQQRLLDLARRLGLPPEPLLLLGVGWDGAAFTFPMRDATARVIGVRRRFSNGARCAVSGSQNGLIMPRKLRADGLLFITEGETDAAALLSVGLNAVGRPGCDCCVRLCAELAVGRDVVAVSDRDDMGRRGAATLCQALVPRAAQVRLVTAISPHKDIREEVKAGLNRDELLYRVERAPVVRPPTVQSSPLSFSSMKRRTN